jgi:hypothetical protein
LARKTHHIERFNNTLRQRVSRRVRDALSFSKKLANHIGAIKLFICHYNLTRAAASSEHYIDITTTNQAIVRETLDAGGRSTVEYREERGEYKLRYP